MPTRRAMALPDFAERFIDVVDHGSQIGPGRQGLLEGGEHTGPRVRAAAIPRFTPRTATPAPPPPPPPRPPPPPAAPPPPPSPARGPRHRRAARPGERPARGRVETAR